MDYEQEVKGLLKENSLMHLLCGLSAECGEVCGIFQKALYKNIPISVEDLKSELGDVLFYIAALGMKFDTTLEELQINNIIKLKQREEK